MKGKTLTFFMIFIMAFLSGCAGNKIYLIDVKYIREGRPPSSSAPRVGVCAFEDTRKKKNKDTIGFRYRRDKQVDLIKVYKVSLSEAVTQAVKDYFAKTGFVVTDCKGWDKSPEGLARLPHDLFLVVGGNIESFAVEARSGLLTTETDYNLKMVASIGQIEKGKVVTQAIEKTSQTKTMRFNAKEVRATLNLMLAEVIEKLFQDVE
jgi:hypothetical protein